MNSKIRKIAEAIAKEGGRAFFVGGCVRDELMGKIPKDADIEVYGISASKLLTVLQSFGTVNAVGRSFGIIKLRMGEEEIDFALPRKDNKTGEGHRGFVITTDPFMPFEEACRRRDFTVNAILKDVLTGEIIDPFGGVRDLKQKVIRHVDASTFVEDPLRVYRGVQFAARLGFEIHPDTLELMKKIDLSSLSRERIYEEFKKLLTKSAKPSIGLRYMEKTGVLEKMHPLLYAMVGCPQDPVHHPEGDVWEHTLLVVDAAAQLRDKSKDPTSFMFAALLHDVGKPVVTEQADGKITSKRHDVVGAELAENFMRTLTDEKALIANVVTLVREHMIPFSLYRDRDRIFDGTIRRFANRAERVGIDEVLLLAEADNAGKGQYKSFEPVKSWFEAKKECLKLDEIKPVLRGRDLIEMGFSPSPMFGKALKLAFEMQLDGVPVETIKQRVYKFMKFG